MAKDKPQKFKDAVLATPEVKDCYREGLQALGIHSSKVLLSDTRKAEGSVEIDACVSEKYPQDNRWDYALGYDGEAYFMEVHTANTSQVSTVLRKLQWLKDWLHAEAPEINKIKAKERTPFYWVFSKKFDIDKNSRQYKLLVQKGLMPTSKLKL
jgi:hypothetical protein